MNLATEIRDMILSNKALAKENLSKQIDAIVDGVLEMLESRRNELTDAMWHEDEPEKPLTSYSTILVKLDSETDLFMRADNFFYKTMLQNRMLERTGFYIRTLYHYFGETGDDAWRVFVRM